MSITCNNNGMGMYRGSLNLKTAKALGIARPTSVLLERTADAQFASSSVGYNLRLVLAWLRIILRVPQTGFLTGDYLDKLIPKLADPDSSCVNSIGTSIAETYGGPMRYGHSTRSSSDFVRLPSMRILKTRATGVL